MKRTMLFVLVAIVAMSVTVFGADKKNGQSADSSLKVTIDFKAACQPGDSVLVVVKASGGKKPLAIYCGARKVGERFYVKPDSSQQNFLVTVADAGGDAQAYSLPIKVFQRVRKNFFIGNFAVKSTNIKTVPNWQGLVKEVVDFYNYWTKAGLIFDIRGFSWADTIHATEDLNKSLSAGRFNAVTKATGIPVTQGDKLIGSETKRGFDYEFVETDASLTRRMDDYTSTAINVKPQIPVAAPQAPIVIPEKKADRIRVPVGAGYAQESPMASIGLRIPLNQDSTRVKSDVHLVGYFGHDGKNFAWAVSAQVDFRLGKGFYAGPILMGGENSPEIGGDFNHADVGFGPLVQFRPTKKFVIEAAVLLNYRTFFRWEGGGKSQPDEVIPELFANLYYAF